MADFNYDVPRVRDADLMRFFAECAKIMGVDHITVQEMGVAGANRIEIGDESDEAAKRLSKSSLYTFDSANVSVPGFRVSVERGKSAAADYVFDKLTISNNPPRNQDTHQRFPDEDVRRINRLINEIFVTPAENVSGLFPNSKTFTLLMRSHQRMLEQMQQTIANVGEQAADVRLKLEQEFDARKRSLDEEVRSRQEELEQRAESERDRLDERQAELDAFKRDLDDRSNTFARRDLHKSLKARIADRAKKFEITPETKSSRTPIHIGVIGGITLLVVLIFYYSGGIPAAVATNNIWAIVAASIKPALLTVALLGLLTWYLRWMNRWFERYADAEFSLKQFELDIDRASWVVETALEWKQFQDVPMPQHLLENISRNLFSRSDKDESADMHPADFLASAILGRASGVNLKVPGAELTFTGKDIKKLQNDEA